ncbi:zinc-binding dehydrogenase [Planctomycetota bacterium]
MKNKGIHYPEPRKMEFYELEDPPADLKFTEILLETLYSGITNGTERHALMAEHGWDEFPGRHGYQHIARVLKTGDGVKDFGEGDIVFLGEYVGHRGWHVVDICQGSPLCIKLPRDIHHEYCALLGVAGVAMRGVRRFRVRAGDNVWVAGQGLIGLFAGQCARAMGARVAVSDVNTERLRIAEELGGHTVINAGDEGLWDQLKEDGPYSHIIDACGVRNLFLDVYRQKLLARKGVIGALAVRDETVINWHTFHTREASLEVSCHFSVDDLRLLLHFIKQDIIKIAPVVTHQVGIDDAPDIYTSLRDKPGDLLGVIFNWQ